MLASLLAWFSVAAAMEKTIEPVPEFDRERSQVESDIERVMRPCVWPGLPERVAVSAITMYEGASLSTVTLSGQDKSTTVAFVEVLPGQDRFFVLLGAMQPVIWVVRGAVERVQGVAVTGGKGAKSGVLGLAKEKIVFLEPDDCFAQGVNGPEAMRRMLGGAGANRVDLVDEYEIHTARLPAGGAARKPAELLSPPVGANAELWKELLHYSPGGVVELDPSAVVGLGKAETYDVRPAEAGLLQLQLEGVLTTDDVDRSPMLFHLLKPMRRYPAGSRQVVFVQPRGFPYPGGEIGHSCLMDQESGEAIEGEEWACDMRRRDR